MIAFNSFHEYLAQIKQEQNMKSIFFEEELECLLDRFVANVASNYNNMVLNFRVSIDEWICLKKKNRRIQLHRTQLLQSSISFDS